MRRPIAINIIPPATLIRNPNESPSLQPNENPINESEKVMRPIIRIGMIIEV